jgi:beta-glucanase (GH16 family)
MVSGLARCSFALRPAGSLTRFRAFCTKGFDHFIASMIASAATGWSVSCRVGLVTLPLEFCAFPRRTENGHLKLHALKRDGRILLGAVGTQNRFMARYGYCECRAQLQKSPGIWGAFWIQSPDIAKGEDPAIFGAEIDIMECFKKLGPDIVSHNVHWAYGPHQKTTRGMQSYLKGVNEGFHTFGLEWTPEHYVFFVDGYRFYEVTNGVSHIEEYLILSMEVPSDPKELKDTVFPDVFVVDYVKAYQKKRNAGVKKSQ